MKQCPTSTCSKCAFFIEGACTNDFSKEGGYVSRPTFRVSEHMDHTKGDRMSPDEFDIVLKDYRREHDTQAEAYQLWFTRDEERLVIMSAGEQVFTVVVTRGGVQS